MAIWPTTLPQLPLRAGILETTPKLVIRTTMDAGPEKMRRRFTAGSRNIKHVMEMTKAQVAIFDAFYLTNCAIGFDFVDTRTGVSKEFRFLSPPVYAFSKSLKWNVSLSLEQMP